MIFKHTMHQLKTFFKPEYTNKLLCLYIKLVWAA